MDLLVLDELTDDEEILAYCESYAVKWMHRII